VENDVADNGDIIKEDKAVDPRSSVRRKKIMKLFESVMEYIF